MKCPDGIVSASLDDALSDGASVCSNEEGNVTVASCTTRRNSEDIGGEDASVAPLPTVEVGDVGGVAHLNPPLDDANVEVVALLSNSDDVTISEKGR